MGKQKLAHYATIATRANVIEEGKEIYETIKGNWAAFFKNNNPITVELGCGRGEYTTGLARVEPNQNFVGVDIKGARICLGSTRAMEEQLHNVAFLRTQINHLDQYFESGEVAHIWITFPDPRPRDKEERHRLTCERFVEIYRKVLSPDGTIHFKTDSDFLFDYTLDLLQKSTIINAKNLVFTHDVYQSDLLADHHGIKTGYEKRFLAEGKKIKYLKFKL